MYRPAIEAYGLSKGMPGGAGVEARRADCLSQVEAALEVSLRGVMGAQGCNRCLRSQGVMGV